MTTLEVIQRLLKETEDDHEAEERMCLVYALRDVAQKGERTWTEEEVQEVLREMRAPIDYT